MNTLTRFEEESRRDARTRPQLQDKDTRGRPVHEDPWENPRYFVRMLKKIEGGEANAAIPAEVQAKLTADAGVPPTVHVHVHVLLRLTSVSCKCRMLQLCSILCSVFHNCSLSLNAYCLVLSCPHLMPQYGSPA